MVKSPFTVALRCFNVAARESEITCVSSAKQLRSRTSVQPSAHQGRGFHSGSDPSRSSTFVWSRARPATLLMVHPGVELGLAPVRA